MSICNIRIEFAEAGPVPTGRWLRGDVVAEVSDDVTADAVVLELDLDTHGRGHRQSTVVASLTLPGGPWLAGHEVRVPFAIQIPEAGPITYRGVLFQVDWQLRARVDLPWKIDPKTAEDLVVVAGARTTPIGKSNTSATLPRGPSQVFGPGLSGCLALGLLPLLIIGLGLLVTGVKAVPGWNTLSLERGGLLIAMGAALVYGTAMGFRYLLSEHRTRRAVGQAALILAQRRVAPGQEIAAHLDLPLRVAGRLEEVTAELVGEEVSLSADGPPSQGQRYSGWQKHVFARWPLSAHCREDGTHIRCEVSGKVRAQAAPTIRAHDNKVRWEVHAIVKLRNRPAITWEEELIVDSIRPPAEDGVWFRSLRERVVMALARPDATRHAPTARNMPAQGNAMGSLDVFLSAHRGHEPPARSLGFSRSCGTGRAEARATNGRFMESNADCFTAPAGRTNRGPCRTGGPHQRAVG